MPILDPNATDANLLPQDPSTGGVPPPAMRQSAADDLSGTGANGPQYSNLDFWAAQLRSTTYGQILENTRLRAENNVGAAPPPPYDPNYGTGHVPAGLEHFADQFVGLQTPEEIRYKQQQIEQRVSDMKVLGQSPYSTVVAFPLNLVDPTAIASGLAFPAAGPSRLVNAIKTAAVGAAVGAGQEVLTHNLDPLHQYGWDSVVNVGASTVLSGILGAAMRIGVKPEEFERLRAHLEAELDRNFGLQANEAATGDTAEKIAADLRARVEAHGQSLEQAAQAHAAAAEGISPADVQARIQAAQERLEAAKAPEVTPEAREQAISEEMQRLAQPEAVRARLEGQYGEKLPEVLRARAEVNLAELERPLTEERAAAQRDLDAALEDQARLERAAAAQAELQRFRGEPATEEQAPIPGPEDIHAGTDIEGLRPDVSPTESAGGPREGGPRQPVVETDPGGAAPGGEPVAGRRAPIAAHEIATAGSPLEGLGTVFAGHPEEGAGPPADLHLQNPLELRSDQMPRFETPEQARAWATQQIARGHDGLVIDSSHAGGPVHYVSFHPAQIGPRSVPKGVSSAPRIEEDVHSQLEAVGRFGDEANRAYATFVADAYATLARRLGITADELYQGFPLKISGGDARGFNQPRRANDPYTRDMFHEPATAASTDPFHNEEPPGIYRRATEVTPSMLRTLGAERINTPEEAAQAFAYLARGSTERFDALLTDRDGKPLAIVGNFLGTSGEARVYTDVVLQEAFRVRGAANIWFGHNHPSGNPRLSDPDIAINQRLADMFKGSSIKPRGILAIGGGAMLDERPWSWADHEQGRQAGLTPPFEEGSKVPLATREFVRYDTPLGNADSPTKAVGLAKAIAGDSTGLLLLDNRHVATGFLPFDSDSMAQLRGTGNYERIVRALSHVNSTKVIIVDNGTVHPESVRNVANMMRFADMQVLDVVNTAEGRSWTQKGLDLISGGKWYQDMQHQAPFYSAAVRALEIHPQQKASASQWIGTLDNLKGVKAGELEWMGVKDWLREKGDAPVSKQDLLTYMRDHQVELKDVTKGAGTDNRPKFAQYTSQGGENYREHLMILPTRTHPNAEALREDVRTARKTLMELGATHKAVRESLLDMIPETESATMARAHLMMRHQMGIAADQILEGHQQEAQAKGLRGWKDILAAEGVKPWQLEDFDKALDHMLENARQYRAARDAYMAADRAFEAAIDHGYQQGHWDERNVIAHVRTKERVDADGKRTLHLEELQSDWHQRGAHEGYAPEGRVPNAPLKKEWPAMALKRMVRYAAENGFDRLSWTTGDVQRERYNLRFEVDRIDVHTSEGPFSRAAGQQLELIGYKNNRTVTQKLINPADLDNHLGRELAAEVRSQLDAGKSVATLEGKHFDISGQGLKGFYDQTLPRVAKQIGGKYGAEVGRTHITTGERTDRLEPLNQEEIAELTQLQERNANGFDHLNDDQIGRMLELEVREQVGGGRAMETEEAHTLDLPPELKRAALEGQPLWQDNRGSYDPSTRTIALLDKADPSTFLHETGHHFLDILSSLARQPDAPLSIREDMDTLLKWFNVPDLDTWHAMNIEEQRPSHEKFASSFEAYLKEGVAPSTRLEGIFAKFRSWLAEVYKSMRSWGQQLTPEVRGVMDRLLASEEDIEAARQARVEKAPTPLLKRVAGDDTLREALRQMAERETGWGQVGGRMLRTELNQGRGNEFEISRTNWIPNSEWWADRPGPAGRGYSEEEVRHIVDKALAGEKLGKVQHQLIEHMVAAEDARTANAPFVPEGLELERAGLEPGNPQDQADAAKVARLAAIDEDALETLARRFENDDRGFMQAVEELLHAHDEDSKIARSVALHQETTGGPKHGGTPAGLARAADRGGRLAQGPAEPAEPVQPGVPARTRQGGGSLELTAPEGRAGAQPDTGGAAGPRGPDALAEEQRRRDALRNSGQQDLFSQGPRSLRDEFAHHLARLPPEARAEFEKRIAALEHPDTTARTPLMAAPSDSTAGALSAVDRNQDLQKYQYARGGRTLGKLTGWFAPGSRALSSPFVTMRKAAVRLVDTPEMLNMNVPSEARPFGAPTPDSVEAKLLRWEGNWATAHALRDQLFKQMRARIPKDTVGEIPDELRQANPWAAKKAFNEMVSQAMRRGDMALVDEVEKAAKATRKIVFDPLKVEAQKAGLLPMEEEGLLRGTADSYLMRQYDRAKIEKNPREWHELLVEGFKAQGMDDATASDVAHTVTNNIKGSELGLLDLNESVFDKIPQSGRLISRQILLPDEKLEPFLKNDIDSLSHAYLRSLAPQVEMVKAFPGDDRNLKGVAQDIFDEYKILKQRAMVDNDIVTANNLDRRFNRDIRDLAAMRDRLYGLQGAPADPSSWAVRAGRMIRAGNGLRLLGTATFSHIPDIANVVMNRGLPKTFAAALRLSTSLEALNLNREQMHRVGAALDMIMNSTAAQLGEFGIDSAYPVQRALNRSMRAFTIATLETPWIATCKMLAGAAAHDELLEAAERVHAGEDLSARELTRFNRMGVGQMDLERMGEQFAQYGKTVNGLRFGMSDLWHDKGAAGLLDAVTASSANASTLHPSAGDTPIWTSGEIGKALFQFKTFGAVAVRKVLIPLAQGLAQGDARSFQGLATLIGAGALTYTMKQLISGQPIEQKPDRYALEVLDKSNLLGWTSEFFYPSLWSMGAGNFSRWGDRQTWETIGGPVAGAAVDAWDLRLPAKTTAQLSHNPDPRTRFTRSDLHRIRRLLPANQVWYLRRGVNALEGQLGDSMGLPPQAPRGSTE